jgi:hypothetical protein
MSDERLEEGGEALQRSASAMIFQGAEAFGTAATGLGALAAGREAAFPALDALAALLPPGP